MIMREENYRDFLGDTLSSSSSAVSSIADASLPVASRNWAFCSSVENHTSCRGRQYVRSVMREGACVVS